MSAKNYTYIYSVAQGISWWDTKIVVFSDTQVPNLFEERRPKRQNLLETETHISLIIPFSCPALYHSSFRAIDARASCQITSNFLTSTMVIMVKTFIMVVKVVIVYRRTDLTFKLDFSGNFCRAVFAILVMFTFKTSKWWMAFQKSHWLPTCQKLLDNFENFRILWGAPYPSFWHNINEITIGAGKRKVKTLLSNECGVKSERLVIYCFLLPSDVSTRVPISGCRFSYHSHFSRHSQTTIVPLATRGASFSQKKLHTLLEDDAGENSPPSSYPLPVFNEGCTFYQPRGKVNRAISR